MDKPCFQSRLQVKASRKDLRSLRSRAACEFVPPHGPLEHSQELLDLGGDLGGDFRALLQSAGRSAGDSAVAGCWACQGWPYR